MSINVKRKGPNVQSPGTDNRIRLQFDRTDHSSPLQSPHIGKQTLTTMLNKLRDSKETIGTETHRSGGLIEDKTMKAIEDINIKEEQEEIDSPVEDDNIKQALEPESLTARSKSHPAKLKKRDQSTVADYMRKRQ